MVESNTYNLHLDKLTLGEYVKLRRIGKGLRQIDLASQTGLNVQDITNIEKNRLNIIPDG